MDVKFSRGVRKRKRTEQYNSDKLSTADSFKGKKMIIGVIALEEKGFEKARVLLVS